MPCYDLLVANLERLSDKSYLKCRFRHYAYKSFYVQHRIHICSTYGTNVLTLLTHIEFTPVSYGIYRKHILSN